MVYSWRHFIRSLLYPPVCVLCGQWGDDDLDLCRPCRQELPHNGACCRRCALPLSPPGDLAGGLCGACLNRPFPFDRTLAPLIYAPPVGQMIHALKYAGRLQYAELLGTLLARAVEATGGPLPPWVVPVPLHPRRQRQRGFNQAIELARPLSRQLSVGVEPHRCRRTVQTQCQSELDARARRTNVRGAFAWDGGAVPEHVAVLDDVVTTGHTAAEVAGLLRRRGARRVELWSVARALPPGH